ncbi:MAG: biotin carboxylase N-terminal domain-containing protein [Acidobacteriota bacterium]
MRSIDKLLVANRGEIAIRVMRTARAMGIATVAVYSDADAGAPHVRFADEAVRVGPAPARESYLVIPSILDAARTTGADAIHPGYGFLSENPLFAEAVAEAGLVFVGPPAHVIRALGSKQAAKRLAQRAGVPVVPGYHGDDQGSLIEHAAEIGYPLLVKASAGGGGKGMRVVRSHGDLADAIERARGEAKSAFGDDTLLLERYVDRPRHIEIQILGDTHGDVVHLHERECSIQRRHQKIVEESPSVALDEQRRAAMGDAAVALGREVGYVGAGTVEFIVDPAGHFYFLEVNTRLQVEHPVTEFVTGLDLVREQLRIARGERVPHVPAQRGWAIEVRLCAEDPERDYLPTTGTLLAVDVPDTVRADVGVTAGSEIGIHYDSMLGKIIAHAPTRREAAQVLRRALEQTWVPGVTTNREHLVRILAHPAFLAGELDTHFVEHHAGELAARAPGLDRVRVAAVAAPLDALAAQRDPRELAPPGWRNVRWADEQVTYELGDAEVSVGYRPVGRESGTCAYELAIGGKPTRVTAFGKDGDRVWFVEGNGHRRTARVARAGARVYVLSEGQLFGFAERPRFPDAAKHEVAGGLVAPMPGKVVKVLVTEGEAVAPGAPLVVLEAMKMEHTVRAHDGGIVRAIHVAVGDQVEHDRLLAVVTPA